ncbi:41915_t:CDS:2, partial [Gigaspora margarita]
MSDRKGKNSFTRQSMYEGDEKWIYMEYDKWGKIVKSNSQEVVVAHWIRKNDTLQRCKGCSKNIKKKECCFFKYQKDLVSDIIVNRKKKIHTEIKKLLGHQLQKNRLKWKKVLQIIQIKNIELEIWFENRVMITSQLEEVTTDMEVQRW